MIEAGRLNLIEATEIGLQIRGTSLGLLSRSDDRTNVATGSVMSTVRARLFSLRWG